METTTYTESYGVTTDTTSFLRATYLHLVGAVAVFIVVEFLLFQSGVATAVAPIMTSNWLIVLGGFMVIGFLANYLTRGDASPAMQYVNMGITILLQAIIFIPLLAYAIYFTDDTVLSSAAAISLTIFGAMTAIVAYSGKDFSFLGPFLAIIGIAALLGIVGAVIFSVSLGFYFALAMVVFAAGNVLYETSNIIHHYREGQHIAAATNLFASVALLFYYVLTALISRE